MTPDKRNYGLDFLRIVSMLFVVILHIIGHGGLLYTTPDSGSFSTVWLMNIIAYPAVNCFVLISGYVGYHEENYYPNLRNIIYLYFTAIFYSLVLHGIFNFLHPQDFSLKTWVYALLPVSTRQYWFFSCYFILFFVSPMIHCFVDHMNTKMCITSFGIIFLFLSIPTLFFDPIGMNKGFGFIWFMVMYLLGSIIKKTNLCAKISIGKTLLLTGFMYLLTWGVKLSSLWKDIWVDGTQLSDILIAYSSPTILLASLGIFCLFAKLKVKPCFQKILKLLTPGIFSVYLIHDNLYIRNYAIAGQFFYINDRPALLIPAVIFIIALVIFLLCLAIDRLRIGLFRLLHISFLSAKSENLLKSLCSHFEKNE